MCVHIFTELLSLPTSNHYVILYFHPRESYPDAYDRQTTDCKRHILYRARVVKYLPQLQGEQPTSQSAISALTHNAPQEVITMLRTNELNPIQLYCTRNPLVLFTSSISIVLESPGHVCKMKLS